MVAMLEGNDGLSAGGRPGKLYGILNSLCP